jgi:hypothetical protein
MGDGEYIGVMVIAFTVAMAIAAALISFVI